MGSADAEPTADAAASPEAEADPWYGYYGYRPYGYGYYGYRPYGYGYSMERGLLMLSPLLMLLPVLRLRPIPGTDTTDTATGLTAMDTMATDLTVMPTGVKLRPTTTSCF